MISHIYGLSAVIISSTILVTIGLLPNSALPREQKTRRNILALSGMERGHVWMNGVCDYAYCDSSHIIKSFNPRRSEMGDERISLNDLNTDKETVIDELKGYTSGHVSPDGNYIIAELTNRQIDSHDEHKPGLFMTCSKKLQCVFFVVLTCIIRVRR